RNPSRKPAWSRKAQRQNNPVITNFMKTEYHLPDQVQDPAGVALARSVPPPPETSSDPSASPPASRRSRALAVGFVLITLSLGLIAGVVPRVRAHGRLVSAAAENNLPVVSILPAMREG